MGGNVCLPGAGQGAQRGCSRAELGKGRHSVVAQLQQVGRHTRQRSPHSCPVLARPRPPGRAVHRHQFLISEAKSACLGQEAQMAAETRSFTEGPTPQTDWQSPCSCHGGVGVWGTIPYPRKSSPDSWCQGTAPHRAGEAAFHKWFQKYSGTDSFLFLCRRFLEPG